MSPLSPASATLRLSRPLTIAIRKEDPARIWERRSPLTPDAVSALIRDHNVRVVVEPCSRRIFSNTQFLQAGASVQHSLDDAHIVLGIKEPNLSSLPPLLGPASNDIPRTLLMFSHTTKGQLYNLPLLSAFLNNPTSPTLIDYEHLTDSRTGKRTVGFGYFAGIAGTLEGFIASGIDLLHLGIASPFLHLPRPHTHRSLEHVHSSLAHLSDHITQSGTPPEIGPYIVTLTGTGNVSRGVLSTLTHLPVEWVQVQDLPSLAADTNPNLKKIYAVHATPSTYLSMPSHPNQPFVKEHYYANPKEYISEFWSKVAPYTSLLLNGALYTPNSPRLLSTLQMSAALNIARGLRRKRMTISDITCDISGGLEFVDRSTTVDQSTFTATIPVSPSSSEPPSESESIFVSAVDILPTTLPLDASVHFCEKLTPYLQTLINRYRRNFPEELGAVTSSNSVQPEWEESLDRATVAKGGKLNTQHTWLYDLLEKPPIIVPSSSTSKQPRTSKRSSSPMDGILPKKRILLLGSGLVARPFIEKLSGRNDLEVVVGSESVKEATELITPFQASAASISACKMDATDPAALDDLISQADVIVSLLPAPLHPLVAKHCIKNSKHLLTASYISPEMKALDSDAKAVGVLLLSEIGLDPGLDHCTAFSLLQSLQRQGLEPVSFVSFCGGLPSQVGQTMSQNPLNYKFSWSPLGVLKAALNSAQFRLRKGKYTVPGNRLMSNHFGALRLEGVNDDFVGIANRDSLSYLQPYGLHDPNTDTQPIRSMVRGTLRYSGFCETMNVLISLGLLDSSTPFQLERWDDLGRRAFNVSHKVNLKRGDANSFRDAVRQYVSTPVPDTLWRWMGNIGMIPSDRESLPVDFRLPAKPLTSIEYLAMVLGRQLAYGRDETDLVLLQHEIIARPKAQGDQKDDHEDVFTSTLLLTGKPVGGSSAMAITVGLPLALATLEVVDGRILETGVRGPLVVWRAVLSGMVDSGIHIKEERRRVRSDGRGTVALTLEQQLLAASQTC